MPSPDADDVLQPLDKLEARLAGAVAPLGLSVRNFMVVVKHRMVQVIFDVDEDQVRKAGKDADIDRQLAEMAQAEAERDVAQAAADAREALRNKVANEDWLEGGDET